MTITAPASGHPTPGQGAPPKQVVDSEQAK
jgi:hypothetical protein